jgi:predicted Zn finger-like uncharacterized protein
MPTTVACPDCGTKLRLPDGLAGQEVRCARCSATFVVPANTPDEPSGSPQPGDERPFPPPPPAPPGEDLAFRLNLSLDDGPPGASRERPVRAPDSDREQRPPRRPALNDEHDDLIECPRCGKHTHRDSVRCPFCGQRLSRPSGERRPYFSRRDAEPHRGGLVLALGIGAIVGSFCAPFGLVLGVLAWVLGRSDLNKMKKGEMDPAGEGMTQGGWICGIIATALSLLTAIGCGAIWTSAIFAVERGPQRIPPGMGQPVPQRQRRF